MIKKIVRHFRYRWSFSSSRDYFWDIFRAVFPEHRYHIIKTSLSSGYHDPDTIIFAAIFDITKEFVEHGGDCINWEDTEYRKAAWKAFKNATSFWNRRRKELVYDPKENWDEIKKHLYAIIEHLPAMWY